ncbi:MAGE family-domain-containing protein [Lipomyces japonicus]|uniref:MAGE family-domain-containing protein n=1 Tax=Lipomyces japonicus TaxID=56871 RepID=UPI0034CFA927
MSGTSRQGKRKSRQADDEFNYNSDSPERRSSNHGRSQRASITSQQDGEFVPTQKSKNAVNRDLIDRMAKKLVRLALKQATSDLPLRRSHINEQVIEPTERRSFNAVFEEAQERLKEKLGMELVKLPERAVPKNGIVQKRKKHQVKKQASANQAYIIRSLLPQQYRDLPVLQPVNDNDSIFAGIAMTVCSLILLSGGSMAESSLKKNLRTLGVENRTPVGGESTENILKDLVKKEYVERMREDGGTGESIWEYTIGPRAQLVLPKDSIVNFIVNVYGANAPERLAQKADAAIETAIEEARREREYATRGITENPADKKSLKSIRQLTMQDSNDGPKSKKRLTRQERQAELERDEYEDDSEDEDDSDDEDGSDDEDDSEDSEVDESDEEE